MGFHCIQRCNIIISVGLKWCFTAYRGVFSFQRIHIQEVYPISGCWNKEVSLVFVNMLNDELSSFFFYSKDDDGPLNLNFGFELDEYMESELSTFVEVCIISTMPSTDNFQLTINVLAGSAGKPLVHSCMLCYIYTIRHKIKNFTCNNLSFCVSPLIHE